MTDKKALTPAAVRTAKPSEKRTWIRDGASVLYLQIEPYGSKSFVVRFRPAPGAPQISRTIGPAETVALDVARLRAAEIVRALRAAPDSPAAAPKGGSLTWAMVLDAYEQHHCSKMRQGAERMRILRKDTTGWLALSVSSLRKTDATALLDVLYKRAPVVGNRMVSFLIHIGGWLVSRGELQENPFAGLRKRHAETDRKVILTIPQMAAVWVAAERHGAPWETLFPLLILTALRRSEVAKAEWSEFDLGARVWTIPPARMKASQGTSTEHRVPLGDAMLDILAAAPTGRYLIQNRGQLPPSGWSDVAERIRNKAAAIAKVAGIEPLPAWTIHDIRRSVATAIANPPLDIAPHVVDRILAHTAPDGAMARKYIRTDLLDQRAAAMASWATLILAEVERVRALAGPVAEKPDVAAAAADLTVSATEAARRIGVTEAAIRKARKRLASAVPIR